MCLGVYSIIGADCTGKKPNLWGTVVGKSGSVTGGISEEGGVSIPLNSMRPISRIITFAIIFCLSHFLGGFSCHHAPTPLLIAVVAVGGDIVVVTIPTREARQSHQ